VLASWDEIGSAPWGVHTVQDNPVPGHHNKTAPEGFWGNIWHTLGDLFPFTSLGKMWNNTIDAIRSMKIRSMKSGTPIGITPEARVYSNPPSGSGTPGSSPVQGAPPNE